MRKLPDESDRVGEHDAPVRRAHAARRRIERGEKLVRRVYAGSRQLIEESRFTRVGVSGERRHVDLAPMARAALRCALRLDPRELVLEDFDALAQELPVGFKLGFARTPQSDTASLPLEVGPSSHEAGRKVLELGKLDLQLTLMGMCTLREDVQYQAHAIHDPALQAALEIALLHGREFVVEDRHSGTRG